MVNVSSLARKNVRGFMALGLAFSIGTLFYLAFFADNQRPERLLDDTILSGCYRNGAARLKIDAQRMSKDGKIVAHIGNLSQIKSQTYSNMTAVDKNYANGTGGSFLAVSLRAGEVRSIRLN